MEKVGFRKVSERFLEGFCSTGLTVDLSSLAAQVLQTAERRSDGPVPSIIAKNRSLETISGKYKRRGNSDTTDTVVRSSETVPQGEFGC